MADSYVLSVRRVTGSICCSNLLMRAESEECVEEGRQRAERVRTQMIGCFDAKRVVGSLENFSNEIVLGDEIGQFSFECSIAYFEVGDVRTELSVELIVVRRVPRDQSCSYVR